MGDNMEKYKLDEISAQANMFLKSQGIKHIHIIPTNGKYALLFKTTEKQIIKKLHDWPILAIFALYCGERPELKKG